MKMFRTKTSKQKPALHREPSRGPAAYDSRPAPAPVRPLNRALSDSATPPSVEPNTLVVAVDFGNCPPSTVVFSANDRQARLSLV
jgi:hypothetical protein